MNATHLRRIAAAAALLTVPALSSCGQLDPQTDAVYTPSVGVNNRDAMVDVLHALIVADGEGSGRLVAGLANNDLDEADELTGVRGEQVDQSTDFTLTGGETTVPAGGFLQLADSDSAAVLASGDRVTPGGFVRLTFSFANAGDVTVNVPVVANDGDYADVEIPSAGSGSGESETPTE